MDPTFPNVSTASTVTGASTSIGFPSLSYARGTIGTSTSNSNLVGETGLSCLYIFFQSVSTGKVFVANTVPPVTVRTSFTP